MAEIEDGFLTSNPVVLSCDVEEEGKILQNVKEVKS
jgi:hypothetical protein